jgi:lysozyme
MSQSPESAVDWWMNDWIHRVNILTPHWDKIGVGAALSGNGWWVFVTDFANLDGAYEPFEASTYTARAENAPGAVEEIPSGGLNYTVASGDTLLGIGLRYGLDWQDLAIANNMGEFDILSVGQPLYIPSVGGTGGPVESDGAAVEAGDEVHEVQPGDTLLTISFRYGVDWQAIAAVNGLGEYDLLQIGQTLALPASVSADGPPSSSRQAANANAEEANAEEADGSSTDDAASETDTSSAESSNAGAGSFTGSYTVQAGDTLSTIAIDFAIDWETLAAANNLSEDDYLQVGQTLVVPGDSLTGATAAEDEEMAAASAARLTLTPITKSYEVEPGDTALAIALRHGISLEELLAANGLDDDSILGIGDLLEIPQ